MLPLVTFTVAYTGVLLVYGLMADSPLTVLYTGVNVGLMLVLAWLHRSIGWSRASLWLASVVGLGNMLGGVLLVDGQTLYMYPVLGSLHYDKVFHFLACALLSPLAWETVARTVRPDARGGITGLPLVVWLCVMGGGAGVEIAEFIGASMGDMNVGDYANNAVDLVANGLGALVGTAIVSGSRRRSLKPAR
jgi:hypothetical protein